MKKLFKFIAYLIGLVVALAVVAAVAVAVFIDPNDFRDDAVAAVKKETGRDLEIGGDVGWTFYPWLGIRIEDVQLGNAPGFADPYFARVEKVHVRAKLMPLLSRQLELDTITIHGLALNLARDAEGKSNWDDLAGRGDAPGKPASGGGGGGELAGLALGGLDVKNARLQWSDAQTGQKLSVDRLDLETGAVMPGKPVSLSLEATMSGDALPGGKAEVSLAGKVLADQQAGTYTVHDLELGAKLSGDALPGGEAEVSLAGNLLAEPQTRRYAIRDLELGAMDLAATGSLEVNGDRVSGSLAVAEFDLKKLLAALGQPAPVTADPDALGKVALDLELAGTMGALDVKPLSVTVDDSRLEGGVSVAGFGAKLPAVRFALALDGIDADRYLPPPAPGEEPAVATPGTAAARGAGLPMDTLRALDLDGTLKVGELKAAGLTTSDVVVTVKAKDGLIMLSPLAARLYEGSYAGAVSLDARQAEPLISADEKLTGLQIGPLLADLTGQDRLTGTTELSAKVTARGADADAIKRTLGGDVAFAFTEGAVNGINVARTIREFMAKLKGETLPPSKETLKTDFSRITGTFQIADGVATNQDLKASSPLLRVVGRGIVDLAADQLDYRPTVTLVATMQGEGGEDLENLVGVPIPLRVHGPLAHPEYGVDFDAAVEVVAKSKAQDLIKGQLDAKGLSVDKLGEALPGGLGDALPGALGGALPGVLGGTDTGGADTAGASAGSEDPAGKDSGTAAAEKSQEETKERVDEAVGGAIKGLKGLFGN